MDSSHVKSPILLSIYIFILFFTTQTVFSQPVTAQQSTTSQQPVITKTPSATQVFLYHKEIFDIIETETDFRPSIVACTSRVNSFHNCLYNVSDYSVITNKTMEDYRYTIPYTNDACVIASRKTDSFENISDVIQLKYASIQASVIVNDWLKQLGANIDISEAQQVSLQVCLEKIYRGDFDYTIFPQRLLQGALEASNLTNEIHLSRPLFFCEYRMAIPKDDYLTLINVNDTLAKYQQNGVFRKLAKKYGIDEYTTSNTTSSQLIVVYIITVIVSILLTLLIVQLITRRKRIAKKNILNNRIITLQQKLDQSKEQEAILRNDIENLTNQVTKSDTALRETLISEQYTGLFRKDYLISQIKREIQTFNLSGRPFSVATLVLHDASLFNREIVKHISSVIMSNTNDFAQSCYDGFGTFFILYPRQKAAEVRVITDNLLELMLDNSQINNFTTESIRVSQVLEYNGQGFDQFISLIQDR